MPYVASTRSGLLGVDDDKVRSAAMADVQGSLTALGERALRTIEALEAEKARVEARLLAAYGALHTIESQQVETLALAAGSLHVSADRVVSEEIALATGVGVGEVARRLSLATAPRRHRAILAALRSGATTLHRALQVVSETAALSDADVAAVEQAVLAPSRDRQPVPQRTFVTRLRRAIASVDGRGSDERRAHARSRRGVGRPTGPERPGTHRRREALREACRAKWRARCSDRVRQGSRRRARSPRGGHGRCRSRAPERPLAGRAQG